MSNTKALKLKIHDEVFGYLIGKADGRNILHFDTIYRNNPNRKTLSLLTQHNSEWMDKPKNSTFVINPLLSNLLPEGSLRELICTNLKISNNNEVELLCSLGNDLPGAVTAQEVPIDELPPYLQQQYSDVSNDYHSLNSSFANKFSLAGVQMKYSMSHIDGRFTLSSNSLLGDWIVKTPSNLYKDVPVNEYSCMKLAALLGINIPEIKLVEIDNIKGLSNIKLPDERYAYAIKRFDRRNNNIKVHIEDFAQILYLPPHKKYGHANYTTIGQFIYKFSSKPLEDIQEYMKRLLCNILLGNGDAHLKNWSMIYPDSYQAQLSPAYDIVSTIDYISSDSLALNFAKTKNFSDINLASFEYTCKKIGVPFKAISKHLLDTINMAREQWPNELKNLPMSSAQKSKLKDHWQNLHDDFKIPTINK